MEVADQRFCNIGQPFFIKNLLEAHAHQFNGVQICGRNLIFIQFLEKFLALGYQGLPDVFDQIRIQFNALRLPATALGCRE